MAFNRETFTAAFNGTLKRLERAEHITKEVLKPLSRDLLFMLHTDDKNAGDIGYINRTIAVLSPANKKVFVLFMKEFTGFICNDEDTMFMKKRKAHYAEVQKKALAWLEDPLNNYWSWVGRQKIEAQPKDFDLEVIKDTTKKLLAKAAKNNISHAQVLGAMFDAGLSLDDLMVMLDNAGKVGDVLGRIEEEYVKA